MLNEKTIEFELKSLGPLVVHIFLKLFIFMTKQESPRQIFELQKAMCLASSDLGKVTKFNPKIQDFKRVLNLT